MLLTINTDLSRSIIARYMSILPSIASEAQLVYLNNAADGQTEQSNTQPVLRQNIQNIWHIHNCTQQNTILNIRLGLQFAGRFAGAASQCAAIQLRGVLQTERLISMITNGTTVTLGSSAPQPLIKADSPQQSTVLPNEAPPAIPPQKVWTSHHTTQLLTYLEQTVQPGAAPIVKEAPIPAPTNTKQLPAKAEKSILEAVHNHRVGVTPQTMQLFNSLHNHNSLIPFAAPQRLMIEQALPTDSHAHPQPLTTSLREPLAVPDASLVQKSAGTPQPTQALQHPQNPQSTNPPGQPVSTTQPPRAQAPQTQPPSVKAPERQPEEPFSTPSLVHAPGTPTVDGSAAKPAGKALLNPTLAPSKAIKTELPRHAATQPVKPSPVPPIDSPERPFAPASRTLPEPQVKPDIPAAPKKAGESREPSPRAPQPHPATARASQVFLPSALHLHAETAVSRPELSVESGRITAPSFSKSPVFRGVLRLNPSAQAQLPHPLTPTSATPSFTSAALKRAQAVPRETAALPPAPLLLENTGSPSSAPHQGGESVLAPANFTPVQAVHRAAPQTVSSRADDDDSLDIPTVIHPAKTVQGETTSETVTRNISVNAPQTITTSAGQQAAAEAVALHLEGEVNRLSDEIYRKLEQRFRSEKMRRGLW